MGNVGIETSEEASTSTANVHHPLENQKNEVESARVNGHGSRSNGDDALLSPLPIKIPIIGFETMEERAKFTIFKLKVENDTLDDSWLVFRRYTDFVRLHSKLKEEVPDIEITIPPKRWLRDNFETAFLEERMKGLQALIDSMLVQPELVALPTIRKFFCLDEPPVYADTSEETKSWCGIIEDSAVMLRHRLHEKEREVELLQAELTLLHTQKDNLVKMARNCRNCCQKQLVSSALTSPSSFSFGNSTIHLSSGIMPSSGSSSEHGSPRHRTSLPPSIGNTLVSKHRKNSTSSRTSSIQSDLLESTSSRSRNMKESKRLSNGSFRNEESHLATVNVPSKKDNVPSQLN